MNIFDRLLSRLAKPAQRTILNAGIMNIEGISSLTEDEFKKLHGIGKNAMSIVRELLNENNLSFRKDRSEEL